MSPQSQPVAAGQPTADGQTRAQRSQPALRVVRAAAPTTTGASGTQSRRSRAAAQGNSAGKHAQRSGSPASSLAEVQIGISVLQLADQALGEVAVLLRKLRDLAIQSAGRDAANRDELQRQAFSLVQQIALISREVRFEGAQILDGSLSGREIGLPGGGRACVDVAPMSGHTLGIESPWGRATTSRGTGDVQLVASTGTLPSGTFRVVDGQVYDEADAQVATYDGAVVDFGDGVTATFDGSLYFEGSGGGPKSGVFLLDSVVSLRTGSAAEHAVGVVDRAAAIITEQRLLLGWSRSQLAQAATDVLARRAPGVEVLDAVLAADGARGLAQVIVDNGETALAAHSATRTR